MRIAVLAVVLAACSTSTPPPERLTRITGRTPARREVEPAKPNPAAFRAPVFLTGEPIRPFLDLGPALRWDLLAEADRLEADGFIIDSRPVSDVYSRKDWSSWHVTGGNALIGLIFVVAYLVQDPPWQKAPIAAVYGYRAFRYLNPDSLPKKIIIDGEEVILPDPIWRFLDNATDLRDQFARLNALFASGRLGAASYERVRDRLVHGAQI